MQIKSIVIYEERRFFDVFFRLIAGLVGDPVVASRLSNIHGGNGPVELASARRLRLENERLVAEVARLRRLLLSGASRGEVGGEDAALEEEARFVALEMELQHAREALQALKADRKRLKAEKFDLLNQMKALYGTLEDKERELRDFIRNYEQVSVSWKNFLSFIF